MNKEQPELTALQLAYNQGIEDAMCAIRAESQGGGYWAATYINAIARRCSPYWYVAAKFTEPTYDQVVHAITDIQEARESHVQWAAHLRDTNREDCKGCDDHAAHIGDAAYHDEWIAKYDNAIYVLAHAPFTDAAATTSPEIPVGGEAQHHKHCSIWTVTTSGARRPCDCVCECTHSMFQHIRPGEHAWYEDCAVDDCSCMKFTAAPVTGTGDEK